MSKSGLLLVNLGTPDSPEAEDVRQFLREFLSDPKVLGGFKWTREALVNGIICPLRGRKSAEAYGKIWTDEGSPIMVHGRRLTAKVATLLADRDVETRLAMRYRNPSLSSALSELAAKGVEDLVVLPLFPQWSSSTSGSIETEVRRLVRDSDLEMRLRFVADFFEHPGFIAAQAERAAPVIEARKPDVVIFSYHGLPEDFLRKDDPSGSRCLWSADCCARVDEANRRCYRAQCFATSRALAAQLGLSVERHRTTFQSRFGPTKWIEPYTDATVESLAHEGAKRLVVLCPAFVADCIETDEEIGMQLRGDFIKAGGADLYAVPCVNDSDTWAQGVVDLFDQALGARPSA